MILRKVFDPNGISVADIQTAVTAGITLTNPTLATNPVPVQRSPSSVQVGHGWTGAADQAALFRDQVRPIDGTNPITAKKFWSAKIGSGSEIDVLDLSNLGDLHVVATLAVDAGATVRKDAIGTGQTSGLTVKNTTAAANGAPQYSPAMVAEGRGWDGSSDKSVQWKRQVRTIQSNPIASDYVYTTLTQGGSPVDILEFRYTAAGNLIIQVPDLTSASLTVKGPQAASLLHGANAFFQAGASGGDGTNNNSTVFGGDTYIVCGGPDSYGHGGGDVIISADAAALDGSGIDLGFSQNIAAILIGHNATFFGAGATFNECPVYFYSPINTDLSFNGNANYKINMVQSTAGGAGHGMIYTAGGGGDAVGVTPGGQGGPSRAQGAKGGAGSGSVNPGMGGNLELFAGDPGTYNGFGGANAGSVFIESRAGVGTGTSGAIYVGNTGTAPQLINVGQATVPQINIDAVAIAIGHSGVETTVNGSLTGVINNNRHPMSTNTTGLPTVWPANQTLIFHSGSWAGGDRAQYLPDIATAGSGNCNYVQVKTGSGMGSSTLYLYPFGTTQIDDNGVGVAIPINSDWSALNFFTDGTKWYRLDTITAASEVYPHQILYEGGLANKSLLNLQRAASHGAAVTTKGYLGLTSGDDVVLRSSANAAKAQLQSNTGSGVISVDDNIGARMLYGKDITVDSANIHLNGPVDAQGTVTIASTYNLTLAGGLYAQTQAASGAGTPTSAFLLTAGAHTAVTAEAVDIDFALNRTVIVSTAPATWRAVRFRAPTWSKASAGTVTDGATVSISGAPIPGGAGPLAITNPMALWLESGMARFDDATDSAAPVYGLWLLNQHAPGSAGAYSSPPKLTLQGKGRFGATTYDQIWDVRLDGLGEATDTTTLNHNGSFGIVDGSGNHAIECRSDGTNIGLGLYGVAPVTRQAIGATATNNVTSGGTTAQLDDFAGAVYATDSAAIRNDIYQLGEMIRQMQAGLKLLGAMKT